VYSLLELVDPMSGQQKPTVSLTACLYARGNSQLLEIAVRNVVAAPIGHRIELDAVRELHIVLLVEFADLLRSPCFAPCKLLFAVLDTRVIGELEFLEVCKPVCAGRERRPPANGQPYRGGGVDS